MPAVFEKLNLKNQRQIAILNAPATFKTELSRLTGVTVVRQLTGLQELEFVLAFVTTDGEAVFLQRHRER